MIDHSERETLPELASLADIVSELRALRLAMVRQEEPAPTIIRLCDGNTNRTFRSSTRLRVRTIIVGSRTDWTAIGDNSGILTLYAGTAPIWRTPATGGNPMPVPFTFVIEPGQDIWATYAGSAQDALTANSFSLYLVAYAEPGN